MVLKSGWQGWFLLEALRENQFQAFLPASGGGPWCSWLHSLPPHSLPPWLHGLFFLTVSSLLVSYKNTSHWI